MKTSHAPGADLDQAILLEAADWMVLMQSGEASDSDHAQLERWQAISPDHEEAWRRAEELLGALDRVPGKLARGALSRLPSPERRQILRLGLLLLAAPTASWLALRHTPWREWSADLRTATGEQRTLDLADGTRLVLNTASAVNVSLTASERRLTLLTGEILITTGSDPSPMSRPFIVQTSHGTLRALGTRFSARRLENATRAAVFEGAVEVRPAHSGQVAILNAGEQLTFSAQTLASVRPVDASAALWEGGMLLVRDMPLGELLAELGRYHRGVLRCDPAVAGLTISGSFPVMDLHASLDMVASTLPVRIGSATPWWITVQAH